jgi:selenocysteine lyase/cysteine desulfurase
VALTRSTNDGINSVTSGLHLRRRDEVLTSDEEHPSLLAPLARLRRRLGVDIRIAPFEEIASAAGPRTRLIACSHVSWVTGRVADTDALRASGVPLLLDGAQALGAIPVDVRAIGCDYYAAPGQKWLCGPDGTGVLYVHPDRIQTLDPPWPSYFTLGDPGEPLELVYHSNAARFDLGNVIGALATWALASLELLEDTGWDFVLERGPALAERFAADLRGRGIEVMPRGRSTLVSWRAGRADEQVLRLADERFVLRSIPGRELIRASVGAWSSEEELDRLAGLAA